MTGVVPAVYVLLSCGILPLDGVHQRFGPHPYSRSPELSEKNPGTVLRKASSVLIVDLPRPLRQTKMPLTLGPTSLSGFVLLTKHQIHIRRNVQVPFSRNGT